MSDAKENESGNRERAGPTTLAALLLLLLPCLYLLASGPITWLDHNGYVSEQARSVLYIIYWPVIYLATHIDAVGKVFNSWCDLWR